MSLTLETLGIVGRRVPRVDAREKVTGKACYTVDFSLPGMLYGALVASDQAKGRIRSVDASRALAMPGVVAVVTAADLRRAPIGCADIRYGCTIRDRPILADGEVRYVGEPVAAVAAQDERLAREAARRVSVTIDPLPAATDLRGALAGGAPLVHEGAVYEREEALFGGQGVVRAGASNICETHEIGDGDATAAFGAAARSFAGRYTFPSVYQYAMEPFCVVASARADELTVWSTQQHPYQVERDLARLFGYRTSQVRLINAYLGGGFGSKAFTHLEPIAVALSRAAGQPVKLELDIPQSVLSSRRHGAVCHARLAVDAEGRVAGYEAEIFLDSGAYAMLGPRVALKAAMRALGGYDFPSYRVRSHLVYLNTSPACSYRAIGGPQGNWGLESLLNRAAAGLGADPLDFRRNLVARRGQVFRAGRTPMDADLRGDIDRLERLAGAGATADRDGARSGVGFAMGVCDPGAPPVSTALVRLAADGSVRVAVGSAEMGQGVRTVMAQIAAESLGVSLDAVTVLPTDTGHVPFDSITGGSRATTMAGLAVERAALDVRRRVVRQAADAWACAGSDVRIEGGQVSAPGGLTAAVGSFVSDFFGEPGGGNFIGRGEVTRADFPLAPPFWEVALGGARVAVDRDTGEVRVLAYDSVSDVGRAIHPTLLEGQDEGAALQGIGHTLFEHLAWDGGQLLNGSLADYRVPRFADVPDTVRTAFVENGDGPGPFGAKGAGEAAIVPPAAAIAAALHDATGLWANDLPLLPERIWRSLRAMAGAAAAAAGGADHPTEV